jgi:hypothetical protein
LIANNIPTREVVYQISIDVTRTYTSILEAESILSFNRRAQNLIEISEFIKNSETSLIRTALKRLFRKSGFGAFERIDLKMPQFKPFWWINLISWM